MHCKISHLRGSHRDNRPARIRGLEVSGSWGSSHKDLRVTRKTRKCKWRGRMWVTTSHLGTADRPGESWGSWRGQARGAHGRADDREGGAQGRGWHRGWGWGPRASKGRGC